MNTMPDLDEREARNWAMLCHITALSLFICVPFGNVFGPLIVWMIKGKQSPLVDDQGKEAVNFGITMTIFYAVLTVGVFLWIGLPVLLMVLNQMIVNQSIAGLFAVGASTLIAFLIFPVLHFFLIVVGAIRAANGEYHRYPFTIRFLR